MYAFGVVRLRFIWIETLANRFILPFFGICVATLVSTCSDIRIWSCLHKMLLFGFVPARTSFLACSDTLDIFCARVLYHQIDKLALV